MRTFASTLAAIALTGTFAATGLAAPIAAPPPGNAGDPSVIHVQGWWEREHLDQQGRDAYWRLPPPLLRRYNDLQREINQLMQQRNSIDDRIHRAEQDQRRILNLR